MRTVAALAALVLVPFLAVAQEPSAQPPGEASRQPLWSFGTGVSVNVIGFPTVLGPVSGSGVASIAVPGVTASLERKVSDRTWLALGVLGLVSRNRDDIPPGGFGVTRDDARQLVVTAGVRRPLTRAGAPVEVSALVLAEGGIVDADFRMVSGDSETRQDLTTWLAGAEVGIALDRVLTGPLSLRVASPLLGAQYARTEIDVEGRPGRTTTGFSAQVLLAPRLELRLAF
jgi:hypothetical protein